MKITIIIAARMASDRLPGKVLLPLAGIPMLEHVVRRAAASQLATDVVVATTLEPRDNPIRELCRTLKIECFGGHATDLLDRYYSAGLHNRSDAVVKLSADAPLIDPAAVDQVINTWLDRFRWLDYVGNLFPPVRPEGQGAELFTIDALKQAVMSAVDPFEREHVSPFILRHPEFFRTEHASLPLPAERSTDYRFCVDYLEDYQMVGQIFDALWTASSRTFGLEEIIRLLQNRKDIAAINREHLGKSWNLVAQKELNRAGIQFSSDRSALNGVNGMIDMKDRPADVLTTLKV